LLNVHIITVIADVVNDVFVIADVASNVIAVAVTNTSFESPSI